MLKIECIVRGYLSGSAWQEYQRSGTVNGMPMPAGMQETEQLPMPDVHAVDQGRAGRARREHQLRGVVRHRRQGDVDLAREVSVELYRMGAERALTKGIVIADTKFELGFIDGELRMCDEALTMDSSRFWPADEVTPGQTPPSFDKQPVRDYSESLGWDKTPPAPPMPEAVIAGHPHPLHRRVRNISGLRSPIGRARP